MNTFPLTFEKHVAFCVIGFIFFVIQFFRQGFKYQLVTGIAIASTLLLYINESTTWRYAVGVLELVLLLLIFILMATEKKKAEQKALEAEKAKALAEITEETVSVAAAAAEEITEAAEEITETVENTAGDKNNE